VVVGWSLWVWGFEASTHNITQTQPYRKSTPHRTRHISVRVHPYAHPQHLKVLKCLVYIDDMVRGCSLWGVGASAMTLQHHSDSAIAHIFQNPPLTFRGISIRVHPPYAHLQHLKVLKHVAYICHGWGMQSLGVWVWSLIHDLTTTLRLSHAPIFQKSTASKGAKTLCISNMDVGCSQWGF